MALEEIGMPNNHYSPLIALCTVLAVLLVDVSVSGLSEECKARPAIMSLTELPTEFQGIVRQLNKLMHCID